MTVDCYAIVVVFFIVGIIIITIITGVIVGQYLQNVTKRFDLGAELLYQYGGSVPGGQIGIYTIAGRYSGMLSEVKCT